jgi:2,4-dienoyl-CoA reductase (NADPH2)
MGSMHLGYEGVEGGAERMAEFYAARARGGVALIITGGCAINDEAVGGDNFMRSYKPEDVATLQTITTRVHEEGGRIGLQLFHAGRYATREWLGGLTPVSASAIRSSLHPTTPRAMNEEDIARTISDFARAAAMARDTGFDCVEIMGSEGYLINQFFSRLTNTRQDDWGGTPENRMRFGVEVMKAVRSRTASDFPVIYRMSGIDLMPGSNGWNETFAFARAVESAGANALNIGIGWHESRIPTISMLVPRAYYAFAGDRIRKHVSIPIICSNRINDPEVAEDLLAAGKADFVSAARALLADPEFAAKARNGRQSFINTCIACNQACLDNAFRNEPTACLVNPEAGRELELRLVPAQYKKRYAVVGAGPAGLEAARGLAQRGHQVTLFDRNAQIGGQLLYAIRVPGKEEFANTLRYYRASLEEAGVRFELGCEAKPEDLAGFDGVIMATGASPHVPQIPGSSSNRCIHYDEFFRLTGSGENSLPKDIAIIGAGGIGCDIAHMLSDSPGLYPPSTFFDDPDHVAQYEHHIASFPIQHNVSLTRRGRRIGEKLGPTTRWALLQLLENRGVRMHTQIQYEAITADGLKLRSRTGKSLMAPAQLIIFAAGQLPDDALYQRIKDAIPECYLIGAAKSASETNARTAIREACELAYSL